MALRHSLTAAARAVVMALAPAALALLLATAARAHPHVWVEARSAILFGDGGIVAVRHAWTFDEAFSVFAIQGLDTDGDGKLSARELEPLARTNIESLHEYDFFTFLTGDDGSDGSPHFVTPTDYRLDWDGRQLTLHFTLPLRRPLAAGRGTVGFEVFDPDYFVDFAFAETDAARLVAAPAGCALTVHRPAALDSATQALLADIPASMRELPPELGRITADLANRIDVACR